MLPILFLWFGGWFINWMLFVLFRLKQLKEELERLQNFEQPVERLIKVVIIALERVFRMLDAVSHLYKLCKCLVHCVLQVTQL